MMKKCEKERIYGKREIRDMDTNINNITLPWTEWKVEKLLGRGSFGEVYQVVRNELGTSMRAAIKIIHIPMDDSELEELEDSGISARSYLDKLVTDITNEIILMQTLKGAPNIVGIEDYKIVESTEKVQWTIYIRMELLTDLNHYRREHKLTYEQVIQMGCDLCNALDICRQKKIVHRDIKPSNIFISPYGEYKLGDFGISKHTDNTKSAFSSKKGTYSYMAPEVYRGEKYGYSIDLYSLGVVIYQLSNNGRLPFYPPAGVNVQPGDVDEAQEKRNMGIPFPDPATGGEELGDILRKACHIDPHQRYNSPLEMQAALKKLINKETVVKEENEEDGGTVLLSGDVPESIETPENDDDEKDVNTGNHYKVIILTVVALLGIGAAGLSFYMNNLKHTKEENVMVTETVAETETEKITEPVTESETEKVTEAVTESETEKVTEAITESETEKITEPVTESETEKVTVAVTESKTEKITEAVTESETEKEKVTEAVTESETEKITEPVTESETETIAESETEPVTEEKTEAVTEAEVQTEKATEKVTETELPKEVKSFTVSVEISGEKSTIKILNDTNVKMAKMTLYEAAGSEEAYSITVDEIQSKKKRNIQTEKGKTYHVSLESADGTARLEFYNVSFENVDEIHFCEQDGYTYVNYTKDKKNVDENTEKYRTKTYDKTALKYVMTSSGLNVRALPDNKAGAVVKKLSVANEVEVCGEAKGLIGGEETEWYLIKVDGLYGYISANADYTTDDKATADQKKAEILAAQAAAAAAAQQSYSSYSGSSGGSSGGSKKKSSGGSSDSVTISSW